MVARYGGNPGRSGHKLSMEVSNQVFKVREQEAGKMFHADTENVAFTANCTFAVNMAVKGIMQYGGHIIISDYEHNAVSRHVYSLSKTRGVEYLLPKLQTILMKQYQTLKNLLIHVPNAYAAQ